ncbi:MAG: hypothetical protein J7500_08270 [Sphingomonas sp.]|uniref:ribbon-helix-helix domain-containing protein n=1 Tax=Sphingomonas sp. TaxID=28214 RepID=UPI001B122B1E|nr:hypothetical protein [Sphingomonas sp.]MBO9622693.1 hypothetical protein [Sphingomonas sp.]
MITIRLDLSDSVKRELEARVRESAHATIEDYVRDLIETDLVQEESWEMTPELAAALKEGESSGVDSRSLEDILADARKRWRA